MRGRGPPRRLVLSPGTARGLAPAAVVLLVVAAIAAPALAIGVDSETADTTTTSNLSAGSTLPSAFDASPSNHSYLEFDASDTNPEIRIVDGESGEVVRTYSAGELNQTFANRTRDHYHWARNISHDELANVPIVGNETKNLTVRLVNNASVEDPATAAFNVSLTGVDNRTVIGAHRNATGFEAAPSRGGIELFGRTVFGDPSTMALHAAKPKIGGANSTVRVAVLNATGAAALSDATAGLEPTDWALRVPVTVDGKLVSTYYARPPNATEGTYAVYDPEMAAVTVHLGERFDGRKTADLTVTAGELPALGRVFDAFGTEGVEWYLVNLT